ncbi:hypothetical protein DYB30_014204, partial [Aphanomyces astaci]
TLWKDDEPLQDKRGCRIYGNPTALWNSGISVDFLSYDFSAGPDRYMKKLFLLWDDF